MSTTDIDLSLDDIIKIQRKEKKKQNQNKGKNATQKPGQKAGQKNKIKQFRGAIGGKKLAGMNNLKRNQIALKARRTQNKNKQRLGRQNQVNNNRGLQVNANQKRKPQKNQARKTLNRNFGNKMVADQITQQQTQRRQWKRSNASVQMGTGNQSIMTVSVPNKKPSNDVKVQIAPQALKLNRQQPRLQNNQVNNNNNNMNANKPKRRRNRIRFPTTQTQTQQQFQFKSNDFAKSRTGMTMNERFAAVHNNPKQQNIKQPRQNQQRNQRINRRKNNQARQNQARQNQQNQGRKVFL